jgi:hypothetical protein
MELLLLLGLGAYFLSRQNGGTTPPPTPPPSGSSSGSGSGAGQSPTQGTQVELSTLRLPSIVVAGKPQPLLNLPYPANVVYTNYTCKQPGGAFRASDILDKLQAYTIAYDTAMTEQAYKYPLRLYGRKYQLRKRVDGAKKAYQSAVQFHFTQCSNYAKQL